MSTIQIFTADNNLITHAKSLATQLNLTYTENYHADCDYLLLLTPEHLALQRPGATTPAFYLDFLSKKSLHRQKHLSINNENLARALGLKKLKPKKIIDATAGLGRDSFIIAGLGFEVELIERSPLIFILLTDALTRAANNANLAPVIKRMHVIAGDAIQILPTLTRADVIYLDPMFPPRTKSALVKKEMQIFHDLVGQDTDGDALFDVALTCAEKRVVVKRPRLAPHLANHTPNYSVTGSSSRFDVYLL